MRRQSEDDQMLHWRFLLANHDGRKALPRALWGAIWMIKRRDAQITHLKGEIEQLRAVARQDGQRIMDLECAARVEFPPIRMELKRPIIVEDEE